MDDLRECLDCRNQGECCYFVMNWPTKKKHYRFRSGVACPFLVNGLCSVYPERHKVPWCDFDTNANRGKKREGFYPKWCPHGPSATKEAPPTLAEAYEEDGDFNGWTADTKEAFAHQINALVAQEFSRHFPDWSNLLGATGKSAIEATQIWNREKGFLSPGDFGPVVEGEEQPPYRMLGTDDGQGSGCIVDEPDGSGEPEERPAGGGGLPPESGSRNEDGAGSPTPE